jgi:glucan phosphorylase
MIILLTIILIVFAILMWQHATMTYKIGYFEQKLKNHKDKFDPETWKQIEDVINKKSPF